MAPITAEDASDTQTPAPTSQPDEKFMHTAVDRSNINALRLALLQATGDPELAAMTVRKQKIRGGMQFSFTISDIDTEVVKEKAIAYLNKGPHTVPQPPPRERSAELLELFSGEPLNDAELDFAIEELAFDNFPRQVKWTARPDTKTIDSYNVVIIGAGISGIAAAIQLKQLGIPFTVVERQAGIGGTWLLNTYPEARVDTSSFLFQYTFEKNYKWTDHFAASEENQAYLTYIATKNNVKEHFIFNREVMGAEWNQKDSKWTIQINNKQSGEKETMVANVMISATGVLSTPRLPDIKSIKDFKGPIFHTAQWNHSVPYKDARCALIGTGSTGTQLAPGLAQYAKSLAVYQRSPNWIIPIEGYREPVQDYQKWLCDAMPYYWNWFCYSMYFQSLQVAPLQEHDYAWQAKGGLVNERNDALRLTLTDFIRNKFIDRPDLFEKLLPNHAPLVRRPPIDNGFYDCLKQDNVELVTDKIDHIDETGIVTQDGKHREFDMIVLGSGFMPFKMSSVNYVGRDGITLEETWKKDGARSYLGMTIPGYPNLFTLYGPNHQPRGGSMHSWAEIWTRYAVAAIVHMIENESSSIEIRDDVFEEYNERLDEANKALIWESQGHGYYVNEFGRQCVNMPWRTHLYHQMVKMPKYEEYYIK